MYRHHTDCTGWYIPRTKKKVLIPSYTTSRKENMRTICTVVVWFVACEGLRVQRRSIIKLGLLDGMFGGFSTSARALSVRACWLAVALLRSFFSCQQGAGPTNEVVGVIDGIRQKRLGSSGIIVSEVGLGTQRWVSADRNAPNREGTQIVFVCGGVRQARFKSSHPSHVLT